MSEQRPNEHHVADCRCRACTRRMNGLAWQIEHAKRSIEQWPEWMKRTAYFAGSNEVHNVD